MSPLLSMCLFAPAGWAQDAPVLGPEPPPAPAIPEMAAPQAEPALYGPQPVADVLDSLPSSGETPTNGPTVDSWLSAEGQGPETPSPFSWWLAPLSLLAVGALVWSRKRMGASFALPEDQPMTILSKQTLSPQASLVLLQVQTQDGESRRLLVGVGEKGPVLVSDLGGSIPGFVVPELSQPSAVEVSIEDPEEAARAPSVAPIHERVPRAPRPMAPQAGATPAHTLKAVPRRAPNKGLVGRFTQADLAPDPDDVPQVAAWNKPPAGPRHAPPPRLRHEVEKQEFLSTRDVMAPLQAGAGRRL